MKFKHWNCDIKLEHYYNGQQVLDEKKELDEKIRKLDLFLKSGPIQLQADARVRLGRQLRKMLEYSGILNEIILQDIGDDDD